MLLVALVLGGVLGVLGDRLTSETGPLRATETVARGSTTLDTLPEGPVTVSAESVRLPAGFESTDVREGPAFTIVQSGEVEVVDGGVARTYEAGEFFLEPGGRPRTIRVLETATLAVVRLLPEAAGAPDSE